jgi:hypothetical protein
MSIKWKETLNLNLWTIYGKYYKAKDFDSSKCHKVMKDTWIASL